MKGHQHVHGENCNHGHSHGVSSHNHSHGVQKQGHIHGENCEHGHEDGHEEDDGLTAEERKLRQDLSNKIISLTGEYSDQPSEKNLKKILSCVQELREEDYVNQTMYLMRLAAHLMDYDIYVNVLKLGGMANAKLVLDRNQVALYLLEQLLKYQWSMKEILEESVLIVSETKMIDIKYVFFELYCRLLAREEQDVPQVVAQLFFNVVEALRFNLKAINQLYDNQDKLQKEQHEYFEFLANHFVGFVQKFANLIKEDKSFKKNKQFMDVLDLAQSDERGNLFSKRFDKNLVMKHFFQIFLSHLLEVLKIECEYDNGALNKLKGDIFSKTYQKLRPIFIDSFPSTLDILINHNRFYQFNRYIGKLDHQEGAIEYLLNNSYSEITLSELVLEIATSKHFQFSFKTKFQLQFIAVPIFQYFSNSNKSPLICDRLLKLFLSVQDRLELPQLPNVSEFDVDAGQLLQAINKHYTDSDEVLGLLRFFFKFTIPTQYLLFEMCLEQPESMRFLKEILVYYITKHEDQDPNNNMFVNADNLNLLFVAGVEEINLMSFTDLVHNLISVIYLMIVVVELSSGSPQKVYEGNHILNKFNTVKLFENRWKIFALSCNSQCKILLKTVEQSISELMMQPQRDEKKLEQLHTERGKCENFLEIVTELIGKLNGFIKEFK